MRYFIHIKKSIKSNKPIKLQNNKNITHSITQHNKNNKNITSLSGYQVNVKRALNQRKMKNKIENIDLRNVINNNFRIKVYSTKDNGKTINQLVGYSGLIDLIENPLATNLMINALGSSDQIIINKLRRGIKITFYSK